MVNEKSDKLFLGPFIALLMLIVLVVVLQIMFTNEKTTNLETALFSILQFLITIVLAWILARRSFKEEFLTSQKKFAVSAYRRIKEIDRGIERIISRVRPPYVKRPDRNIEAINAISLGIKDSITSSVADWADVMGEEIATLDKIQGIQQEQESIELETGKTEPGKKSADLERLEEQIERLREKLPYSLRILQRDSMTLEKRIRDQSAELVKELNRDGFLTLNGFWEKGFEQDVGKSAVGDKLDVCLGDVGTRIAVLLVKNNKGKIVGIITNKLRLRYREFVEALTHVLSQSQFKIELTKIDKKMLKGQRRYFEAKVIFKE